MKQKFYAPANPLFLSKLQQFSCRFPAENQQSSQRRVLRKDVLEYTSNECSHHLRRHRINRQLHINNLSTKTIYSIPAHGIYLNNFNGSNLVTAKRRHQLGFVNKSQQEQFCPKKYTNYYAKYTNKRKKFNNRTLISVKYSSRLRMGRKLKEFAVGFLQDSSIHGLGYLARVGLSWIERTLWLAFICVAMFSIISLSHRTWQRFQTSPMVISMDRNKLVWNTSFPSLTVCLHKRIDELKVEEYIMSHPEDFVNAADKEGFKNFIDKLAHLTYENIEHLPVNKSYGITSDKYLDLLYDFKLSYELEISSGTATRMFTVESYTEFGICHSVNSLVARYNSYDYWKSNKWHLLDHGERVTVHPLDGEIYAQIVNLSFAYDIYFHSAGDIPSITKQRYTFSATDYTTVELTALEIYADEAAKTYSPKQRQCRFRHESEEMLTVPIYSYGLCLAECRLFLALRVCNCVPHFYRNTLRNGRVLPICDLRGLSCVAKLKKEMISLQSNRYKINCKCLANCDDSNFFVQAHRSRVWFLGGNFQWGIIEYPKMQLRRDVIFSLADVFVYIGGLAGFFLGCSALSFMEIIYYFTIRFLRKMRA